MPDGLGHEGPDLSWRAGGGDSHRAFDPAFDHAVVKAPLPHARSLRGLIGELRIHQRLRGSQLERPFHRSYEALAVVLQRAGVPDLVPHLGGPRGIRFQVNGAAEQRQGVINLIAADRQLGRAA